MTGVDAGNDVVVPPDNVTPQDVASADSAAPDAAAPDVASPDVAAPDVAAPDAAPPDDAPSPDDAASPDASMPGECNALEFGDAPWAPTEYNPGERPTPMGGAINPGTYELVAITSYGSRVPATPRQRVVLQVTATTIDTVSQPEHVTTVSHGSASYATSGTALTITTTCPPAAMPSMLQYTATADSFIWYADAMDTLRTVTELRFRRR